MTLENKVTTLGTIHAWEISAFGPNGYRAPNIYSPKFFAYGYQWALLFCSKSAYIKNKGYACIYLVLKSEKQAIKMKYQLSILDRENKIHLSTTGWIVSDVFEPTECAFPVRIQNSVLNDKKDEILNDGKLTILCKIFMDFNEIMESVSGKSDNEKNENDFMDYEKYFLSKTFSDMQFIVDEEVFHVHKIILSIRSEVFAAMFAHDMKENNENKVKIENIDSRVFQEVLRYMYTGKVSDIDIIVKDLLVAADKYMLQELKKICEDHFKKTDKNIFEYRIIADTFNLRNLKKKIIMFIAENSEALLSKV